MRAQPPNTTRTSDKVFFTTLYRTFEGLFTSFFSKRIISPRIFEWYCPLPSTISKPNKHKKAPASALKKPG